VVRHIVTVGRQRCQL